MRLCRALPANRRAVRLSAGFVVSGRGFKLGMANLRRNSEQDVSAHAGSRQFSKPSRSCSDAPPQLWKQTGWHSGIRELTVPALVGFASSVANALHSTAMSLSVSPARQIASVRGTIVFLVYHRSEAVTPIGGGGGGGEDSPPTPPGGGGAARRGVW